LYSLHLYYDFEYTKIKVLLVCIKQDFAQKWSWRNEEKQNRAKVQGINELTDEGIKSDEAMVRTLSFLFLVNDITWTTLRSSRKRFSIYTATGSLSRRSPWKNGNLDETTQKRNKQKSRNFIWSYLMSFVILFLRKFENVALESCICKHLWWCHFANSHICHLPFSMMSITTLILFQSAFTLSWNTKNFIQNAIHILW